MVFILERRNYFIFIVIVVILIVVVGNSNVLVNFVGVYRGRKWIISNSYGFNWFNIVKMRKIDFCYLFYNYSVFKEKISIVLSEIF